MAELAPSISEAAADASAAHASAAEAAADASAAHASAAEAAADASAAHASAAEVAATTATSAADAAERGEAEGQGEEERCGCRMKVQAKGVELLTRCRVLSLMHVPDG